MLTEWKPTTSDSPFIRLGGRDAIHALAGRFFRAVEEREPPLFRMYPHDDTGSIDAGMRVRFTLFLMGWLGGPQEYFVTHLHPRMRVQHAHLRIDSAMRDAWLRCMQHALDGAPDIAAGVRAFLDFRFAEMADLLRNSPDE